jgi:hypothetical protein
MLYEIVRMVMDMRSCNMMTSMSRLDRRKGAPDRPRASGGFARSNTRNWPQSFVGGSWFISMKGLTVDTVPGHSDKTGYTAQD